MPVLRSMGPKTTPEISPNDAQVGWINVKFRALSNGENQFYILLSSFFNEQIPGPLETLILGPKS